MSFAVGSLVRARSREWVVLPESTDELLMLRPLGGTDEERAGVLTSIEQVESATFSLPNAQLAGDFRSAKLLRDALRLGFRSGAGPFRSLGRIACEPRPYQLVPLLMALRQDPVRLLIADDVGIGKTIEAGLIARELLDQGEATRLAVICPPHLAEQWKRELAEKFHIDAELVLASTARRLERGLETGQSLFEQYPFTIVSLDFIKTDQHRATFLRSAPELVIVDEAHTCAFGAQERGGMQRYELLKALAKDQKRHLLLVTATPHSGKQDAFRSLLEMLAPSLADMPAELTGVENAPYRRELAKYLVQRRRPDIQHYLDTHTAFPKRNDAELTYALSPEYHDLFDDAVAYARESAKKGGDHRSQRLRWWALVSLLRSIGSSPAAAAETLRNRAPGLDTENVDQLDELGRSMVLGFEEDETEATDVILGAELDADVGFTASERRQLRELADRAEQLKGDKDEKLLGLVKIVKKLIADGFSPIVFCYYIPTAHYVAEELQQRLPKKVAVEAVTGRLSPEEREARVEALGENDQRVLVATDCLSEGVNLQDTFDAVVHYDLAWNPTTHEQREGRVDRFGQANPEVRVTTYYGKDSPIDGIVLNVLIRKHKAIRNALGVYVPVSVGSETVVEAIFEGLVVREASGARGEQLQLDMAEFIKPKQEQLSLEWDAARDRESRTRTVFAQETIKPEEVAAKLAQVTEQLGSPDDVRDFVRAALRSANARVSGDGLMTVDLREARIDLRDLIGREHERLVFSFEPSARAGEIYLHRTHPIVEAIATWVLDTALDEVADGPARRAGVMRTEAVTARTFLLLVRYRFSVDVRRGDRQRRLLAESSGLIAFQGSPSAPEWLADEEILPLLQARPSGNVVGAGESVQRVLDAYPASIAPHVEASAYSRAEDLEAEYRAMREAARAKGVTYRVAPHLPPDVLGVYVFVPLTPGQVR